MPFQFPSEEELTAVVDAALVDVGAAAVVSVARQPEPLLAGALVRPGQVRAGGVAAAARPLLLALVHVKAGGAGGGEPEAAVAGAREGAERVDAVAVVAARAAAEALVCAQHRHDQ